MKLNKKDKALIEKLEKWINRRRKDVYYGQKQFDKLIVFLSGGSLVLTTGFVSNLVHISENTDTSFLKYSWIGFTLTLIIILFSHLSSSRANEIEIEMTREEIDFLKKCEKYSNTKLLRKERNYNRLTIYLNWASVLSLLSGIIIFIIFMTKNI